MKSHRMRPEDVEYVLKTPVGALTCALAHRNLEPPDRYLKPEVLDPEDTRYDLDVYSFYLRMMRDEDLRRARVGGTGLVRVQFGIPVLSALGVEDANEAARLLAPAVLRERVPMPPWRFQPYASAALELFLRGKLKESMTLRAEFTRFLA